MGRTSAMMAWERSRRRSNSTRTRVTPPSGGGRPGKAFSSFWRRSSQRWNSSGVTPASLRSRLSRANSRSRSWGEGVFTLPDIDRTRARIDRPTLARDPAPPGCRRVAHDLP